jgi:hypothetical protein
MNIYRQAIKKDFKKKILLASSALILERYFQTKMEKDLSVLSSSEREQIKELIENYKMKHRVLLSWNLIKESHSYGIPLKAELYDLYDIESKKEQMSLAHQNLLINIKQYHLNSSEYKYTQENIRELSEIIAQRE